MDCIVCIIQELSDPLKQLIRKRLISICEGEYKAEEKATIYTYKATVKEFLRRFEWKGSGMQMGMIGELLAHIFVFEEMDDVRTASPFFNLEERSFTKGFDLVLYNSSTQSVVVVEVKSGECSTTQASKSKNSSLILSAKRDLNKRLSENDQTIWRNAVNKLSMSDHKVRGIVETILEDNLIEARDGLAVSGDDDVVLTSVLFNSVEDPVRLSDISRVKSDIDKEKLFQSTIIFSIQKTTVDAIVKFLTEEAVDE